MTFAQLQAFAESKDQSVIRIALTREGARRLVSEYVAAETRICSCCGTPRNEFDPVAHLSVPSRVNPLASAAAVNLRKERSMP